LLFRLHPDGHSIKKIKHGSTVWSRYSKLARRNWLIRRDPAVTDRTAPMAANDLHEPLGLDGSTSRRTRRSAPWGRIGAGGLGAAILGLVAYSLATDTGLGGRPFAEAVIQRNQPEAPPPPQAPVVAAAPAQAGLPVVRQGAPSGLGSAAVFDADSGGRLVRQGGEAGSGPLIIKVPQATGGDYSQEGLSQALNPPSRQSIGLQLEPAPDPRLVEKGRHGPLPRIGADGSRPSEIYARPEVSAPGLKPGAPRIAIVVGGMGLNAAATSAAVAMLPGAVTLGFAPYGADLDRQTANAREAGHELLLQAPMEPLDKAAIPGPNTLLSGVEASQTVDGLRWLMSRMSGYVGVANFLGGRFMTREADLAPVMREIAARGLLFLDDGTATQSLAPTLAAAAGVPAARADVVLDANPQPEAIKAALGRLEATARAKGFAIGYAAGLPGAMEPIARFARGLEQRGVALAPLSALAARAPPSASLER